MKKTKSFGYQSTQNRETENNIYTNLSQLIIFIALIKLLWLIQGLYIECKLVVSLKLKGGIVVADLEKREFWKSGKLYTSHLPWIPKTKKLYSKIKLHFKNKL